MSDHYEVVFSCFLRDDTPESVLAALRWHLGMDAERPGDLDPEEHLYPLLTPDRNNSRLPGGDIVSLRRTVQGSTAFGQQHAWELFSRNYWVDDSMLCLDSILGLLAPHIARPGYGGYFRDEYDTALTVFTFREGTYGPVEI
ncbi:hypothetical protein OG883_08755 [Streptomyces sp. NBC_01142]|uniref:hypothetical protein n=1 Tax=Streptomyces sp. NBC_01142 TaxID=2975865 RepID=UPI00225C27CC|nr:hypothetical protein [Streptomyces sp. NBC_01142]MCX4819991.1 hypothetical protein [Streptomyces sp. NBC_01142]